MGSLSCPFCCGGIHTTEENLREHLMYVLYRPDRCPICRDDYFYPNKLEFIQHFIQEHKEKGSSEKKIIQNTGGYVSITTSAALQKDLTLLPARDILYQRNETQNAAPTQKHQSGSVLCTDLAEKKKGFQILDERSLHVSVHQPKVLETKEFSLEIHRNQVEESLNLKFFKCKSCGEMIRGENSYVKHIQERHLKKSILSSTSNSENTNISAFSQPTKSLRLSSPQFNNSLNNSPQSFHASSSSIASDSSQLQRYSPITSPQVPPLSSSSPVLSLPSKSSPNLISPMQQGSPDTSSQILSPCGSLNKSWTPTISDKSQERKLSPFPTSPNINSPSKSHNPDRKNTGSPSTNNKTKKDANEPYYGDAGSAGSWIPRNWCLEKVKVKGPLTPDNHSVRSGRSQNSSLNSPSPSEQSIRSGKSWLSSINSPASSEQSGRERFSYINSPGSSEFSYRSGKNPSSISVNSPAPSEQSIAPSPLSIPRYLDANPFSVPESDDFKMLSHKHSLGYNAHVQPRDQDEQICKDKRLPVKQNASDKSLLGNQNVYSSIKNNPKEQHGNIHHSNNQQVINTSAWNEACSSSFNPPNFQEDIFVSPLENQETFKQSYQNESDVLFSSVNNISSLNIDKNEVIIKSKDIMPQSENKTYTSSSILNIQTESYQNKNIGKDENRIESKVSDLSGNYIHQVPPSLNVNTQSIEDYQCPDNYPPSSSELLYLNVENSPSDYIAGSPFLSECNISDVSHQEEPISNIENIIVDSTHDKLSHSQHFKIPVERVTQKPTTSKPSVQQDLTKTISQEAFDMLETEPKKSICEEHKVQMDINSLVNRNPNEGISDIHTARLEANNIIERVSSDPNILEQIAPMECINSSYKESQEVISSDHIPSFQENFISEDINLENIHGVEKIVNRNNETVSEGSTERIVSNVMQNSQEQDKSKTENKICEQKKNINNLIDVAKIEHELIKTSIEHESKDSLSLNSIQLSDDNIIHDDDDDVIDDTGMRVGRENLDSYPHKKFRPDQERSIMQTITVSVRPDQERSNMQSISLAKLNRTFDMDPSEVTRKNISDIEMDRKDYNNEGKEEYFSKIQSYQFICEVCGKGFQNQGDYKAHYNSHEIKSQSTFSSNDTLKKGSKKQSKGLIEKKALYKCDQCSKVFKKKYTLVRHNEEVHTTNKAFVCEICNKEFSTKRSLDNHTDTHLTEKNHKCPQCPHVCQTAGGLRSHISEIHNDIKNKIGEIKCNYPDCQETFSKMYGLKRHIARKHSTARLHGCVHCPSKFFSCKEDLNNHYQSHTKCESMRCKECDKQFTSFWALQRHTLSHNKGADNKFKCLECSQVFTRRDSLVTHTKSKHTTNKSHECETCGLKFVRKNQLQVHQNKKTHTAEPQFSCDYCPKTFRFKDSYKRHINDKSCIKT